MEDANAVIRLESEDQFWQGLNDTLSTHCDSHELIDESLRGWLSLTSAFRDQISDSDGDLFDCSRQLHESSLFQDNKDYVRTQIIYSLLQEDDAAPLHVITCFLLADGRADETLFKRMIDEACFSRLLELLSDGRDGESRLQRKLLELMYEMSRIDRLRPVDLLQVEDIFVGYLLQLIEGGSDDVNDPYHYPTIRVLLVLNEQYMLASTDTPDPKSPTSPLTNRVIKMLSLHGPSFRTFGENIILLLNRETETSQQLLILKVLYLLFTTKATYEYFYTNDLKVLLDIIIRNLMDLPDEKMSLRHTYLRVLYPLLGHTQLSQPPHYKRDEILRVLKILGNTNSSHFAPTDETTLRLVERVSKVKWLADAGRDETVEEPAESGAAAAVTSSQLATPETEVVKKFLGISLSASQTASAVSVIDVAAVTEKPGVKTPSRKAEFGAEARGNGTGGAEGGAGIGAGAGAADENGSSPVEVANATMTAVKQKKALPEVPKHRHGIPYTSATTLHITGKKKLPPKVPPPRRRTKLAPVEATAEGAATPGA